MTNDCPRCGSVKLEEVRPEHYQNMRLRCLKCALEFHPRLDYESNYELWHDGVCGRCEQPLPKEHKT